MFFSLFYSLGNFVFDREKHFGKIFVKKEILITGRRESLFVVLQETIPQDRKNY